MADDGARSPELRRLGELGSPGGPALDEALRLFSILRTRPEEGRAIAQLIALDAAAPLPEPLLVAVASALVDRGEDAAAGGLLASARADSSPALMLRAELLARAGDLPAAVALVERVLLRDIDFPGARERHTRWRDALGVAEPPRRADAGATLVTSAPEAPFRLLREVARGGAGVVYEAEDRDLGRRVALKVYHRADRDRAQLLHEARVAASLAGPGVVRIFDVDPAHGWLAMEWAPLGALRARLGEPIEHWAAPLAAAVARVHAAGWVHHDVKPANVLLRSGREPLLTDFGTARRAGEPSPPGSLGYVSPERLAGRASDPRDDVYGFGRIVQDALDASRSSDPRWRALAAMCTGPDEARPRDGAALVDAVRR